MLNVPETVKALFKQDGVRKNFRVHFPNGELPDITNENIVQESVKFTESLCSQDVLKFGPTEASVIEFETVGIANMYGMTIECGIEIDLTSLTAAQLNDIASGTWDGVYTDLASSDIGFAYFRVPYGVFRIESCPRDHQAMTHRKVTAYGNEAIVQSQFETKKLNLYGQDTIYDPDLYLLFYSLTCTNSKETLLQDGFTTWTSTVHSTSNSGSYYYTIYLADDSSKTIEIMYTWDEYYPTGNDPYLPTNYLYRINQRDYNYNQVLSDFADALEAYGEFDLEKTCEHYNIPVSYSALAKQMLICKQTGYSGDYSSPFIKYYPNGSFRGQFNIDPSNQAIYPYRGENMKCRIHLPTAIVARTGSNPYVYIYQKHAVQKPELLRWTSPQGLPTSKLKFNRTLETVKRVFGVDTTFYSFANCYSQTDFVSSFLELKAMFGKTNRHGLFEMMRLSDQSAIQIQASDYSEFWWDEYVVENIGQVKYKYKDSEENEQVVVYEFGDGQSVYDMTDNTMLEDLDSASETDINDILDTSFTPYLDPITYTPIDLTMKGLPYLESGDYLELTAEDGTTVNTFIMNQTVSGIQVLTANIESTSGDIIESGVNL